MKNLTKSTPAALPLAFIIAIAAVGGLAASPAFADAHVDRTFGGLLKTPQPQAMTPQQSAEAIAGAVDNIPANAYTVTVNSADIRSKNVVYVTPYPVPMHMNAQAVITSVSWVYGVQSRPTGFEAALCYKNSHTCQSVTSQSSGQTSAFNGQDAMQPFILNYQVVGMGKLNAPISGGPTEVVVSYRVLQ